MQEIKETREMNKKNGKEIEKKKRESRTYRT